MSTPACKTLAGIALCGVLLGCSAAVRLGNGSLSGHLPAGWKDSPLATPGMVLRVTDDTIPLPAELVIAEASSRGAVPGPSRWVVEREETRPAPETRVGSGWQQNTRTVRIYRKRFDDGRALEAAADVRFDRARIERFLDGLESASD